MDLIRLGSVGFDFFQIGIHRDRIWSGLLLVRIGVRLWSSAHRIATRPDRCALGTVMAEIEFAIFGNLNCVVAGIFVTLPWFWIFVFDFHRFLLIFTGVHVFLFGFHAFLNDFNDFSSISSVFIDLA